MKKWFVAAGVVTVALVVLVVVGVSNLGPIIKQAVNSQGPGVTGTDLHVGNVDIALFSGRASIEDFLLGNPQGFEAPYAVSVKTIKVDIDEKSLTGDTVIIDRIEVVAPRIIFEKNRGSDNFKALLSNVQRSSAGAEKDAAKADAGRKKLLIREFILRDGKVNLAIKGLKGKDLTASLPEIRLENIGQQQGGATPAQVAKEVFTALYGKITSADMKDVLQKNLSDVKGQVSGLKTGAEKELDATREQTTQSVDAAKESLKGLLGK
ncbi:MAG: hypothetical protein AB7D06_04210 [Pedobacter sp.]